MSAYLYRIGRACYRLRGRVVGVWAIILVGVFFLFTLVLGLGAAKLVGQQTILAAPGGANSAAPLLRGLGLVVPQ